MIRFLKPKSFVLLYLLYGFCQANDHTELNCSSDNFPEFLDELRMSFTNQ